MVFMNITERQRTDLQASQKHNPLLSHDCFFPTVQDEVNQILTTNVWLEQVILTSLHFYVTAAYYAYFKLTIV